jgi:ABC-type branched-subunit amino acid transport system ATPase component/ABC-type branched-subunit amino acid transport system permease subunit
MTLAGRLRGRWDAGRGGTPGSGSTVAAGWHITFPQYALATLAVLVAVEALHAIGILPDYLLYLATAIGIDAIAVVSLNVVNGYLGVFNLGQAGFMGVGGYVSVVLTTMVFHLGPTTDPLSENLLFLVALLAGALAAGVLGFLLALPSMRTSGVYFALVTTAFNLVVVNLIQNIDAVGGALGYEGLPAYPILQLSSFAWVFLSLAGAVWIVRNFMASSRGRQVLAVREDETAAALTGIDTRRPKIHAFALSAALGGLAGGLFVHYLQYANPSSFDIFRSVDLLVMLYLGGVGNIVGSIAGAVVIDVVAEVLRNVLPALALSTVWASVVNPAVLVTILLLRPAGLLGGQDPRAWMPARVRPRPSGSALAVGATPATTGLPSGLPAEPEPAAGPLLELAGVERWFGGLAAVAGVDLRVAREEIVGIIGPNGAGKTTLLNVVSGVYSPTRGEIRLEGRPVGGMASHELVALGLARTFQNIRLFRRMSVLDNVAVANHAQATGYGDLEALLHVGRFAGAERAAYADAWSLLEVFGLADRADDAAGTLAYGLQRRLEIARSLATRPRLLLLDEPAAGMNPREVQELLELLRWVHREWHLTVLIIEHRMPLVMGISDRVIAMDFGRIIASGTPAEVSADPGVIKAYLGEPGAVVA